MLKYKNVEKLVISSNASHSIEWRVSGLIPIISYNTYFSYESPSFRFKTEVLKIKLTVIPHDDYFLIDVVQAHDTSSLTRIAHSIRLGTRTNVSLHEVSHFNEPKGIRPMRLAKLQQCASTDYVAIFVEFSHSDENVESEICLPSVPVASFKSSSPTCKGCGRVEKSGQDILIQNLKELYINKLHCDFTINVGEQKFNVHKAILAAQSKVFEAMLKHDMTEKERSEVDINDCDPDAFHEFLLYLYSGKVEAFSDASVVSMYTIADKYGIEDLKKECVNYMRNNLSVDMFCNFIELAVNHEEMELLKLSKEYFAGNARNILSSANWQAFLLQNATLANELFLLMVPKN